MPVKLLYFNIYSSFKIWLHIYISLYLYILDEVFFTIYIFLLHIQEIGNQKSKHYISLVILPHNNLSAILKLDLYGLYYMQPWMHNTLLKNIHTFILLYFQELADCQEAWTQQHMQHPGEEMFSFASQIISLWKKRYMRGEQVLLLCVLGINSWWRMSRNYVQSDLDNREMTNVMPVWKAL